VSLVGAVPIEPVVVPDLVAGDGWYPDASIKDFRDTYRIGTVVTDRRVAAALANAMAAVAQQLSTWRSDREAAGAERLADASEAGFNGMTIAEQQWQRATYSLAAADLVETHNDISATADGRDRRELRAVTADEHRRNATVAIRAILGKSPNRVSLK